MKKGKPYPMPKKREQGGVTDKTAGYDKTAAFSKCFFRKPELNPTEVEMKILHDLLHSFSLYFSVLYIPPPSGIVMIGSLHQKKRKENKKKPPTHQRIDG